MTALPPVRRDERDGRIEALVRRTGRPHICRAVSPIFGNVRWCVEPGDVLRTFDALDFVDRLNDDHPADAA